MTTPYGAWPSPITMDLVTAGSRALFETRLDGADVYVLEARPEEAGRVVLQRQIPGGSFRDLTPAPLNVRTRAHEYGGGAYAVSDGLVVFSNFADGRLYRLDGTDLAAQALTAGDRLRFADLAFDRSRDRMVAVLEDHLADDHEPANSVVAVSLGDGTVTSLVRGHDFFSDPRPDPASTRLCWLSWDRPNMPWDGTDLWVGALGPDGSVVSSHRVAGGPNESIAQPRWAPDGSLVFVSDRTGWWNLYRWIEGSDGAQPLAPMDAEFAGPQWVFGLCSYAIDGDGRIVAAARSRGRDRLFVIGVHGARDAHLSSTEISGVQVEGGVVVFTAGEPTQPTAVVRYDLVTGHLERLRQTSELTVDPGYHSVPRHVEFPTAGGRTAFAWYYPPTNPGIEAPAGGRPPLVVVSHGGPTACASTGLNLGIQGFTSRGFAVVDVDYGGSTGYGRPFRDRLLGNWGVVDLDDCTGVAIWLAEQGLADRRRLAIRGGSAGGFTTLAALCFRDVFGAGASYFGVGDLEALARDTHKFESRYLDLMVAPYPEGVDIYRERSPIHFVDRISRPVLVLQGTDDRVVPQAQADELVAALARNGVPYAYLLFEEEGHGFRKAENQRRSREAELSFYAQVFGFTLADAIEPIEVVGLADWQAARGAG